jgi:hypothetical protein
MSTTPQPANSCTEAPAEVPLPYGAITEPDAWELWSNKFRVIRTANRTVTGGSCTVHGSALQFPDGRIDDGTSTRADPPGVWVELGAEVALTTTQARELAAVILHTADEIDGWTDTP